jgi:hypothetical protein
MWEMLLCNQLRATESPSAAIETLDWDEVEVLLAAIPRIWGTS